MSKDDLSDFVTPTSVKKAPWRKGFGPIIHGIVWFAIIALLFFVVPRFESIFNDFGVDLPPLTKVLIKASHLVVKLAVVLVPLLVVMVVLDGQVLSALSRKGDVGKSLAWSIVMLTLPLLILGLLLVGLILPLFILIGRLSG
jgi:hypothetical protein